VPKTSGQVGRSLTPAYDVLGTVGGIGQLNTEDGVAPVHDMAAVLTQERAAIAIRRVAILTQLQSVIATVALTGLPPNMWHYGAMAVYSSSLSAIDHLAVLAVAPDGREIPVYAWDNGDPGFIIPLIDPDIGTTANILINQLPNVFPLLMAGADQSQQLSDLRLAVTTNAFGAGNINTVLLAHLAFSAVGGLNSFGVAPPGP